MNIRKITAALALCLLGAPLWAQDARQTVTEQNFIRAESDRYFHTFVRSAGGKLNTFFHVRQPTPLNRQAVVRMNRDTLYSGAVVDTAGGATVTLPAMPDGRYASILVLDNDHYATQVFYQPGTHAIVSDTRYVVVAARIEVKHIDDAAEIALVNRLQDQLRIEARSAEPLPPFAWDSASLDALRARYEQEFQQQKLYAPDWQGKRGEANDKTRHLAAAGAWGLFAPRDAVYLNYTSNQAASGCYRATYAVPEHGAFWSITVYGHDGFMKSERNIVNQNNVQLDSDGRFTVHFGAQAACGEARNRVDITDGWNFLMRIYRPGPPVLAGRYVLPEVTAIAHSGR